jgi:tRNA threonylcarbamoyladenosine biosynthesis protein TsaE
VAELTGTLATSVAETERFAADLAQALSPGCCIALHGELGAGKTQFVRGLVRGLGGDPRQVSSPTFILLNVYDTPRFPVYHLDAYRVAGADDLEAIGFLELLEQPALVVVEWAGRVATLLPPNAIHISLTATSPSTRRITLAGIPGSLPSRQPHA